MSQQNEFDVEDQTEDKIDADLNLLKIVKWIQAQPEYDIKIYWVITELWQDIWPNKFEVHSNLTYVKVNFFIKLKKIFCLFSICFVSILNLW